VRIVPGHAFRLVLAVWGSGVRVPLAPQANRSRSPPLRSVSWLEVSAVQPSPCCIMSCLFASISTVFCSQIGSQHSNNRPRIGAGHVGHSNVSHTYMLCRHVRTGSPHYSTELCRQLRPYHAPPVPVGIEAKTAFCPRSYLSQFTPGLDLPVG
jgi:hypothetical protein